VLELAFFLLDPALAAPEAYQTPLEASSRLVERVVCDDGSSPRRADGSPNWDCEIHGCSPHEPICWSDRLDFCFDESGDDLGICTYRPRKKCGSRWSCFDLWLYCDGVYQCHDDSWVGCTNGSCTPKPTVQASSQGPDSVLYRGEDEAANLCRAESLADPLLHAANAVWAADAVARNNAPGPRRLPGIALDGMKRGHGDV